MECCLRRPIDGPPHSGTGAVGKTPVDESRGQEADGGRHLSVGNVQLYCPSAVVNSLTFAPLSLEAPTRVQVRSAVIQQNLSC